MPIEQPAVVEMHRYDQCHSEASPVCRFCFEARILYTYGDEKHKPDIMHSTKDSSILMRSGYRLLVGLMVHSQDSYWVELRIAVLPSNSQSRVLLNQAVGSPCVWERVIRQVDASCNVRSQDSASLGLFQAVHDWSGCILPSRRFHYIDILLAAVSGFTHFPTEC